MDLALPRMSPLPEGLDRPAEPALLREFEHTQTTALELLLRVASPMFDEFGPKATGLFAVRQSVAMADVVGLIETDEVEAGPPRKRRRQGRASPIEQRVTATSSDATWAELDNVDDNAGDYDPPETSDFRVGLVPFRPAKAKIAQRATVAAKGGASGGRQAARNIVAIQPVPKSGMMNGLDLSERDPVETRSSRRRAKSELSIPDAPDAIPATAMLVETTAPIIHGGSPSDEQDLSEIDPQVAAAAAVVFSTMAPAKVQVDEDGAVTWLTADLESPLLDDRPIASRRSRRSTASQYRKPRRLDASPVKASSSSSSSRDYSDTSGASTGTVTVALDAASMAAAALSMSKLSSMLAASTESTRDDRSSMSDDGETTSDSSPLGLSPSLEPCESNGEMFDHDDSIASAGSGKVSNAGHGQSRKASKRSRSESSDDVVDELEDLDDPEDEDDESMSYQCPSCGKDFTTPQSLTKHMFNHIRQVKGPKAFECPICEKRFRFRGSLTRHIRLHTGDKPFACSECDLRFSQKCNLDSHFRTHTGEKPFHCGECGKAFRFQCQVNQHRCNSASAY